MQKRESVVRQMIDAVWTSYRIYRVWEFFRDHWHH